MARLRIWSGKGEEVIEDKSFKQSVEYARGKFTGMDCGVYDERGTSLSVIGLERSVTGVYVLPSAVTGVFLNREAIAKSGIKVLSLENCSNLRKFEMQNPTNPMVESPLWELTLVLPKEAPCLSKVAVNLICHKFRLIGECNVIDLSLYLCSELEINKSVMDNAKSLYFSSCSGIARICLPETNIADSVYLVNTTTEHLSCHLRSNGLGITNCCKLKVMSVWFERLFLHGTDTESVDCNVKNLVDIENCQKLRIVNVNFDWLNSTYINDMINECYALEEIHLSMDSIYLNFYGQADIGLTINLRSYPNLRRVSFTLNAGSNSGRIDVDSHWRDYKAEIVVNRGVEVTLSKELKQYFKVVREDGLC